MRADLDRLMQERNLDVLIVSGGEMDNPYRRYMLRGAGGVGGSMIIKLQGKPAVAIAPDMEAEEIKSSELEILTYHRDFKAYELLQQYDDPDTRTVKIYERFFEHFGIKKGRIGVYGVGEIGGAWETFKLLSEHFADIEFIGERERKLFDEAVMTKDADEVAIMRDVGKRTSLVMQATWDFIAGHHADGDTVVKANGTPLTVGDVKRFVRRALLDHDLEDTLGMIFAPGRDGGFPHSTGHSETPLKLGQAIVFDLFPRDLNNGYFHDMTRTWSIGHATDEVQRAYDHTLAVLKAVVAALEVDELVGTYNLMNFDMMEEFGYETPITHPGTQIGAMGTVLGHGVGLEVHERPYISHWDNERTGERIQVGNVITIEPGVYYPEREFGIRIEDLIYINEDGQPENLTPMHKQLVIPLKK